MIELDLKLNLNSLNWKTFQAHPVNLLTYISIEVDLFPHFMPEIRFPRERETC